VWASTLLWCSIQVSSNPRAFSFALPPSNTSWSPSKTAHQLSGHVEQTREEWRPSHNKINTFTFNWLWCFLFWSWWWFSHPLQRLSFWRTLSSWMLHRVALVRTDVLEEHSASITRVTRMSEIRTMLAVTSNRCMLQFFLISCPYTCTP
jgi:hypothetical protein